eukprot:CAMPEP_0182428210 /NCGR_PEP_ID=MMETSP1167-20130531/21488_1 /TAXON_ID=2988 /ORGANISM="Mallomonas Sp, Strain CCMP3275" /LENGTH=99 /DNA_ID=CAMNT_0024610957 /DNA_START=246 /DNA_END=542 /DNA_ORIENTATION=-
MASTIDGAKKFETSCAGCHVGGGNAIPFAGDKNLKSAALQKYGYNDVESIVAIIKNGKGSMIPYGEFVSQKGNIIPARFTDAEMKDIAEFVLEKAEADW